MGDTSCEGSRLLAAALGSTFAPGWSCVAHVVAWCGGLPSRASRSCRPVVRLARVLGVLVQGYGGLSLSLCLSLSLSLRGEEEGQRPGPPPHPRATVRAPAALGR